MRRLTAPLLCAAAAGGAKPAPDFGAGFAPSQLDNMNGEYPHATTPGGKPGLFPRQFKDYPGGVESYDWYSPPITTYYSQVWWSPLAPTALPDEMVKKYAGKKVAFVGWEIDQVRRTPDGDVSVPISASYNHHYTSKLIGAGARFKKIHLDGPDDPRAPGLMKESGHGVLQFDQPHYVVERVNESSTGPVSIITSWANGGEYRKTFHGFAPGYAVVVESPTEYQVTPMQIDTWNRAEMNISGPRPPPFVPGPLPRASEAPENPQYSGLLECPMTTRITKAIDGAYTVRNNGGCGEPILTFQECFHAAASTLRTGGQQFFNTTGSDPNRPLGCSVSVHAGSPLSVHVFFNKFTASTIQCAAGASAVMEGATAALVNMSLSLDSTNASATITLSGPSDVWFGVGFGANAMKDQPWTIIVDGHGAVSERKLGGPQPNDHQEGTLLTPSVKVVSSSEAFGSRIVVLSRPLQGSGEDYYTFDTTADPTIPFIAAVGSGAELAYHKDKVPTSLAVLPLGAAAPGACVCPQKPKAFGQATGKLVYHRDANQSVDTGAGSVGFGVQKCKPYPATVLNDHKNPTCDIRYYRGGQWACHHMWSLLDADQQIPWADTPLVFHHKYRFWVQPYNETYHTPIHYGISGSELLIGSPWEYDVPKCAEGVPGCALENGTWIHTVTGSTKGNGRYAQLNFHCHAPTCLSMEVYACAKGTALTDCNATVGKLICRNEPVYGGTGHPTIAGSRFDEPGYIAIPNCVWGSPENGLEPPPDLTDIPLHMVKKCNATWGHYGEMAGGQPFVF